MEFSFPSLMRLYALFAMKLCFPPHAICSPHAHSDGNSGYPPPIEFCHLPSRARYHPTSIYLPDMLFRSQVLAVLCDAVAWTCTLSPRAARLGCIALPDGRKHTLDAEELGNKLDVSRTHFVVCTLCIFVCVFVGASIGAARRRRICAEMTYFPVRATITSYLPSSVVARGGCTCGGDWGNQCRWDAWVSVHLRAGLDHRPTSPMYISLA